MQQLVLIIHVLICISLIILVLIQHGKGADIGASFGSGASQTVFGSQGSGSFLLKLTGSLAAIFFATSLFLSYLAAKEVKETQFLLPSSVTSPVPATQQKNQQSLPMSLPSSLQTQGSGPVEQQNNQK